MSCGKRNVVQVVPKGYGYKTIMSTCGSTGIHGQTLVCDECIKKLEKQYPQGWRSTPGDICKHGTYVGDAGGPDYMCGKCEDGE